MQSTEVARSMRTGARIPRALLKQLTQPGLEASMGKQMPTRTHKPSSLTNSYPQVYC